MRVRYGIPSYIVLNDYQIKEVNDTEKGLIFKQILTQKNLKFRILDSGFAGSGVKELNELKKLNELSLSIVAEELRLYPIRPERAEAPSPGRCPGLGAFGPSART